jgi:flagellar biosynthesis protein FlhA
VFFVAAGILGLIGIVTGMPFLPFVTIGAGVALLGRVASRAAAKRLEAESKAREVVKPAEGPEKVERLLKVDVMEIEVGYALIPLVEEREGGDLLHRVTLVRRQAATDFGVVVPPVRIRDNVRLKPDAYSIKIRGVEMAEGRVLMKHWLAMNPGKVKGRVKGIETTDPVFGLPSLWISPDERAAAEAAGYTVVAPSAILATHLSEVVRRHAADLLGRQELQALLDNVKGELSVVIEELVPAVLPLGQVQKVLHRLLREQVSIRDLGTILEALADHGRTTKSVVQLTERVRQDLGRSLVVGHLDEKGVLRGVTFDLDLERQLLSSIVRDEGEPRLVLEPQTTQRLLDQVAEAVKVCMAVGEQVVFICTQALRPHLFELISRVFPQIAVLSYQEIESVKSVRSLTTVRLDHEDSQVLVGNRA